MNCSHLIATGLVLPLLQQPAFAQTWQEFVRGGSVSGNLRAHYNTRDYETRTDEAGFALGGALLAHTGSYAGIKVGLGYYTAQDLGLNSDNPAKVNRRLGVDLEVLGEAYVAYSGENLAMTAGRQKLQTPFANPGDAFIIPFTFNGYSVTGKLSGGLTLKLDYFNSIKDRASEEFVDVGIWSTGRYGVNLSTTSGTLDFGAIFERDQLRAELWLIDHSELFQTGYIQAHYEWRQRPLAPFVDFQYGLQRETGDALLGQVDAELWGAQAGIVWGTAKLSLGYNEVADRADSFRNGAFLSPYTFSNSPLFTNNMVESLENVDSGAAVKATADFNFSAALKSRISYTSFEFDNVADREAIDFDLTYSFSGVYQGLSLRWRLEVVEADARAVEMINSRIQLQFSF